MLSIIISDKTPTAYFVLHRIIIVVLRLIAQKLISLWVEKSTILFFNMYVRGGALDSLETEKCYVISYNVFITLPPPQIVEQQTSLQNVRSFLIIWKQYSIRSLSWALQAH